MQCHYINLDQAVLRREGLEKNFAMHKTALWSLSRVPAIDQYDVERHAVPGKSRPGEKACFLSHKLVIKNNIHAQAAYMVMEDDVQIGPSTCQCIDGFLSQAGKDLDWDIIFTDILVPNTQTMTELVRLRQSIIKKREIQLINLARFPFAASAAYIVNPKSSLKIFEFLDATKVFDAPYDMILRKLVHDGKLKAFCLFPFLTTLSDYSEDSSIQLSDSIATDFIWNTFRKLIWIDRDIEKVRPLLTRIDRELCDDESRLFAPLFAAQSSSAFKTK